MAENIIIKGARQHNLKNIDLTIPRDKMIVVTGLSGSGKSSLAFDTIYAEGQRRYVESLSAYARQFLGQMDKPDVDYIEGLSPAISIDQKNSARNPRSTVGTVTEIYDYLRLLFARIGHPHCYRCGRPITRQTVTQMVDSLMELPPGTRIQVLAPVIRGRKGEHQKVLAGIRKDGYIRVRVDGEVYSLDEDIPLEKNKKHTIEVVVDRVIIKEDVSSRLAESLETALSLGEGTVTVDVIGDSEMVFSENLACVYCGISIEELTPRMFSFNAPYGACPVCSGLGSTMEIDPDYVVPDKNKSLNEGAIAPWSKGHNGYYQQTLTTVAAHYGFSMDTPFRMLKPEHQEIILYGNKGEKIEFTFVNRFNDLRRYQSDFEGVIPNLERRYRETESDFIKADLERYMSTKPCAECNGARLKPEILSVFVGGKNIHEVTCMTISESVEFFNSLDLTPRETKIAGQVLKEIRQRLGFLCRVGLDYLTLARGAGTLSGGESQRIRLATQIGSGLVGVLYILDEPSIGLHQRDNGKLIETLKDLRDLGNTLVIVEHDEETMRAADCIVDIGPGAGALGGHVVAQGTVEEIMANPDSITGQYLSGKKSIPVPAARRQGNGHCLEIIGAREHNLKNLNVTIPLGLFVCVTGVSGSGKSTLIGDILQRKVSAELYGAKAKPGDHDGIKGIEYLDKIVDIDQSPIGRTPRSNPATYTGVFDLIRDVYSRTTEAKMRGYKPGRFSFNVKGGRCEACKGDGVIKIEMHFLPDVYVPCEECKGSRYNRETLEVKYKGKTIADILNMTVDEAVEFFKNIPRIHRKLKTMQDVGMGYIRLGQPATQLSGGEAQRVKLATELSRRSNGKTLYILDEPTTGLHTADIHKLLQVLQRLVENGDTVLVIEHNLDVIKTADYIIDMGPEGGDKGGRIVAAGTPEEVAAVEESYTGWFLKKVLEREKDEPGGKTAAFTG
jgi:excinuclease ABC subunit A